MVNQGVVPEELLPEWESLTEWQQCLLNAIEEIQGRWKPYERSGGSGSTKTHTFRGSVILRASSPATSYCCGAQFEAFFLAWKDWMGEWFETDDDMSLEQMKKLYSYSFVYAGIPNNNMGLAAPDALPALPALLQWMREEAVSVEVLQDPRHAKFGDLCQIQNGPDPDYGHSVIVLGQGTWNDKDVLHVWSSNKNYDQGWPYSKGQQDGHGVDYYYIDRNIKQSNGSYWTRKFFLARLSD